MSQNTSSAVMQQRAEPHDSLDWFPTPPWATRALCEWVSQSAPTKAFSAWEPACGDGAMARPLGEFFGNVYASDVHSYGFGEVRDFLIPMQGEQRHDWVITNPPFRLGEQFVRRALDMAMDGVAMLVRTAFLEGVGRHRDLFTPHPPRAILQFTERVPMFKCRLDPNGSTATAYCWIVWDARAQGHVETQFRWIAPCRRRLERDGDYPKATEQAA